MTKTRLSIIIPVYNVEKYVRPCLESVFRQGLDEREFEVIIINDGTKDRSMEVIQDIIEQHKNIRVVHQENQGLSVARNNGIDLALGEYILMPDSDDLLIDNSVPVLLEKAIETKADLIIADFLEMSNQEIANLPTISQKKFEMVEKTGEHLFLEELSPRQCYVWRTLYRREFLLENHLRFIPGIYLEDIPFTHECYLKAKKGIRVSWLLNIYRRHSSSVTLSMDKRKEMNFCTAIAATWELTRLKNLSPEVEHKLRDNIFTTFSVMISSVVHDINKASERTEIVDFLRLQAPDLHFSNGMKQKVTSFLFRHCTEFYVFIRLFNAKIIEDRVRPFFNHRIRRLFH